MDSLKLATFFYTRVTNTIAQKAFIKSVTISFDYGDSFGNKYVSISYVAELNDKFHHLSAQEQELILETFAERHYYTFSLSTHSNRYGRQKCILPRLLEFKHIYLSLTLYVTAQLEAHLLADVSLNIQGIDYWPYLNYAEKYFTQLYDSNNYENLLSSHYKTDVVQYKRLHELSIKSKGIYHKQKKIFKVTDHESAGLQLLGMNSIRQILLSHDVPIKITGIKTVDEIHIHVPLYIKALQKEFKVTFDENFYSTDYKQQKLYQLRCLIEYLYDHYLTGEKRKIIEQQKSEFIKNFFIQEDDVLELKEGRLVVTESITLNEGDNIEIKYSILKNNLQKSIRKRIINLEQVSFYLKAADFKEHKEHVPIKRLSLLKRWMEKKKNKTSAFTFKSDLIREV